MDLFSSVTILSSEQATTLPYLTYRLAQDGVEVIRLENPQVGDPNRLVGEPLPGEERMNWYYLCINAGKKAISLNIGHPKGQEILAELIVKLNVDIFATNQMPTTYDKLGISPERLRTIKPDLIWVGLTGFGPDHAEAAYDPILQARGGLMELTGEPDQDPQVIGVPLPDMGTSEHAYGQIMKALYVREKTGQGSTIHVSMLASTTSWLTVPITLTASFGRTITRRGNTHQFFAPITVLPTADGYVYLAVGNDRQWKALASLPEFKSVDRPEYETNRGRIKDLKRLNERLAEASRSLDSEHLLAKMREIRVPCTKIQTIPEVINDPLVRPTLLKSLDERTGTKLTLAPPPVSTPFLQACENRLSFPPRFKEHNAEIYGRIGLEQTNLIELEKEGII